MAAEVLHEAREDFDPVAARSAELLLNELDRFESLLTDLLEISRFDAGAAVLNLEEVDLRDLVQEVVGPMPGLPRPTTLRSRFVPVAMRKPRSTPAGLSGSCATS